MCYKMRNSKNLLGPRAIESNKVKKLLNLNNISNIKRHSDNEAKTLVATTLIWFLLLASMSFEATISSPLLVQQSPINPESGGCFINYIDENMQVIFSSPLLNGLPIAQPTSGMFSIIGNNSDSGNSNQQATFIGLECQFITTQQLLDQLSRLKSASLKLPLASLIVRDSNLTTLSSLPPSINGLKTMVISNASIDLQILKNSQSLNQLTTLEITNEKISNIPQDTFKDMQALKELRLENDEIASLDGDAFHNLDDSLERLNLRRNRFNRFPMAVKNLAQLTVLNLLDNDIIIDTQENDLPEKLEPLLNLRELVMNRINCTCEFSASPFFEWIARTHISGVRCFAPEKLKFQEVIVFERDEFCPRASSGNSRLVPKNYPLLIWCQILLILFIVKKYMQ